MADEKKAPKAGAEKASWFSRFLAWCKNLPRNIAAPFKNMVNELKRVTWPTKRQLIIYSVVVLVFMLFMMIVIGAFDLGSTALVRAIRIGGGSTTAVQVQTVDEAVDAVEEAAEDATEAVTEAAGEVTEAVGETAEAVTEAAEETTEAVTEAAEGAAEETTEAVTDAVQETTEAVQEATEPQE